MEGKKVKGNVGVEAEEEEKDILTRIVDVFSETDLGKFKVNLSAGKDYSNMRKLI